MASKSKRRGRVFRASCILAALIIAGSSFAWFTTKDEVTNRLTASSDYGVSIVESFVPPKNIVPGETVNKDVYAVNTGNVDAFVKESVSGILNYDYEEVVDSFAATNEQLTTAQVNAVMGVLTTEDGITTYEAGSYLAWTDADGVDVGAVNIARKADVDDKTNNPATASNPWKPTVEGAYIFRRSINNTDASNPFTYSGYYFVPGAEDKYYKIVIGDDTYPDVVSQRDNDGDPTPSKYVFDISTDFAQLVKEDGTTHFAAADVDAVTGVLKADPLYRFVKLTKMDDKAVKLTYEDKDTTVGSEHPARLVATYGNGLGTATPESAAAQAAAAQAAVKYQNAKGEYEAAVVSEKNAKANYDYATALANAENKLWKALDAYEGKYKDVNDTGGTKETYDKAAEAVRKYATAIKDGTNRASVSPAIDDGMLNITSNGTPDIEDGKNPLKPQVDNGSGTGIFTQNQWDGYAAGGDPVTTNSGVTALRADAAYQNDFATYIAAYNAIYADSTGLCDLIKTQLEIIETNSAANINGSDQDAANKVKAAVTQLKAYATALTKQVNIMKNAYIALADEEARITGMSNTNTTNDTAFDALVDTAAAFKTNIDNLSNLADAYDTAEDAYNEDQDALSDAKAAWVTAIDTYNTEVGEVSPGAKYAYTNTLSTDVNEQAWDTHTDKHVSEDDGAVIVPAWSAINEADDANPVFSTAEVASLAAYDGSGTRPDLSTNRSYNIRKIADADMPTVGHATTNVIDTIGEKHGTTTTAYSYEDWQAQVAAKKTAMDNAKGVLNDADAAVGSASNIKFYINLADDYDTYWTFDTTTDKSEKADFYLKKVLTAGETSHKLVDSVQFANEVTPADYRNLTFDLDIGLDSIQVTYDGNAYDVDAVNSDDTFKMVATVAATADANGNNVTWGAAPVAGVSTTSYKLKIGANEYDATLTKLDTAVNGHYYELKANTDGVDGDETFYGDSNQKGAEFVNSADSSQKGTLVVNRT